MKRRSDDISRAGPSLARLAWLAQRPSGRYALASLQQELRSEYGSELESAIAKARRKARKTGRAYAVVFAPTMERAYRRMRTRGARQEAYPGYTQATLRFYREYHWPFVVTARPHEQRATAVVVWDTQHGPDVHGWAEKKRERWRESEERVDRRRRLRTSNDPSAGRLRMR